MQTVHSSRGSRLAASPTLKEMERDSVVQMTRKLKGVPAPHKGRFYGIRKGQPYRIMGDFPERAENLVKEYNADVPDVMAHPHALEAFLWASRVDKHNLTLQQAQDEEARAEYEENVAQLVVAANPSLENIEAAQEATRRHRAMLLQLDIVLELTKQRRG